MQPKEIAEEIVEKLEMTKNKKSFYGTLANNLEVEFAVNFIKYSTMNYDEWVRLKESINTVIDSKITARRNEKLKELEKEQENITQKILTLKADMNKKTVSTKSK